MEIIFRNLFSVTIHHRYYRDGVSRDFEVVPTPLTCRLMENYGLLFRKTAGGFNLLYEADPTDPLYRRPRRALREELRFSFLLQWKNFRLLNHSDLPLDAPPGSVYYLNNLNQKIEGGKLLLSRSPFLSSQDSLLSKPLMFQYRTALTGPGADVQVINEAGETVKRERVMAFEGRALWPVDLRAHGPGPYRLEVDETEEARFYASDDLVGRKVFALVDILKNDHVPAPYRLTDSEQDHAVTPKAYIVEIDTRRTYWKYNVVLKYRLKDTAPADWPPGWPGDWAVVVPGRPSVRIEPRPGEIKTLADGSVAVPFVADTPLPLREEPLKGISLKRVNGNGNGAVLRELDNLPNPPLDGIVPNRDENKVFSEVFVYI